MQSKHIPLGIQDSPLVKNIFAKNDLYDHTTPVPPEYTAWVEESTYVEMGTYENIQYVFVTET